MYVYVCMYVYVHREMHNVAISIMFVEHGTMLYGIKFSWRVLFSLKFFTILRIIISSISWCVLLVPNLFFQ